MGIGKSIAKLLTDKGFFVALADMDNIKGPQVAKELGEDKAKFIQCDVSSEHDVKALFQSIISANGQVDVVVNNAGILRDNIIWKMSSEDFDAVIKVNLKGTWLMCKEAAVIMRQQNSGRIVNITSRAWLGNRGQTNYSASKAGVVGLTRSLALELGKYNVFVNAVAPGLIDTPLTQALPENVREKLIAAQPTKSVGKPEDVANMVAFLASEDSQFMTGQTLYVDGGKSIGAG